MKSKIGETWLIFFTCVSKMNRCLNIFDLCTCSDLAISIFVFIFMVGDSLSPRAIKNDASYRTGI